MQSFPPNKNDTILFFSPHNFMDVLKWSKIWSGFGFTFIKHPEYIFALFFSTFLSGNANLVLTVKKVWSLSLSSLLWMLLCPGLNSHTAVVWLLWSGCRVWSSWCYSGRMRFIQETSPRVYPADQTSTHSNTCLFTFWVTALFYCPAGTKLDCEAELWRFQSPG